MHRFGLMGVGMVCMGAALSQDIVYDDAVYDENIHSVQLYHGEDRLTPPLVGLQGDEPLTLRFDDLSGSAATYTWTLLLCDYDWKPVAWPQNMYLGGALREDITDFRFSFGSPLPYVTYRARVPSENVKPLVSGNYLLYVFRNFDFHAPVLTRRLWVVENIVEPQGFVKDAGGGPLFGKGQDVMFTIDVASLGSVNPFTDVAVSVYQNFRRDNARHNLKPIFVAGSKLDFQLIDGSNTFPGWNEFRLLDLRTLNIRPSRAVALTEDESGIKHVVMAVDSSRSQRPHALYADLNGLGRIITLDGRDPDTDGLYAKVVLRLYAPEGPEITGPVYVLGPWSHGELRQEFQMHYDPVSKIYSLELFLKQGIYPYLYVTGRGSQVSPWYYEGSHARTDNNYLILVYFKDPLRRFHRLVGFRNLNSMRDR
ncbi:MAG: DUF5103 domain-containing protein [Flavobacteriales bacterium]|nr:DUF5103 domain-containing protein [Flavobacteriales bacterium]MCX7769336.1 DUF5103 domain-containing protein [Flavobacteriales bacterium]MDW8410562.1 DUF5103 domain-containing protein [Flavobacteriales bacterium]